MKKDIHPKYYTDAKVICACGNTFTVGSTVPEIKIEMCSSCHPFYTGKQKLIGNAGRVDRFSRLAAKKTAASAVRKGKKAKKVTSLARAKDKKEK